MGKLTYLLFLFVICVGLGSYRVQGQSTAFNYQGSLQLSGAPANGNFDFQFLLFDSLSGGSQLGSTINSNAVTVTNGFFSVSLDFGGQFPGANRFLEIHVRQTAGGSFTTLGPRQQVASAPYSIKTLNADIATDSAQLGGVAANLYVVTGDSRLTDARNPLPGSSNYIQNQVVAPQASSNFYISGTGIVGGQLGVGANALSARLQVLEQTSIPAAHITSVAPTGVSNGMIVTAGTNANDMSFLAENKAGNPLLMVRGDGFVGVGTKVPSATAKLESDATGSIGVFGKSDISSGVDGHSVSGEGVFGFSQTGYGVVGESNTNYGGRFINGVSIEPPAGANREILLSGGLATGAEIKLTGSGSAHFSIYNSGNSSLTIANTSSNILPNTAGTPLMSLTSVGNIGIGTTAPTFRLHVSGETRTNLLSIDNFVSNAGGPTLCASTSTNRVGLCSSSLRYKANIGSYYSGLATINRLRPITFNWKENGMADFGLAAEDVEKVDPQLVYYNKQQQVEGVKYDHIGVLLINAVKEQQAQIEADKKQIASLFAQVQNQRAVNQKQEAEIEALRILVCAKNRSAAICRKHPK